MTGNGALQRETPLERALFDVTQQYNYLNHAAAGVLPRPTREALHRFIDAHATAGVVGVASYERDMDAYRTALAQFVGGKAGSVAILRSTGDGANAVRGGLSWSAGDEVILQDNEFGANVYPWLPVRESGARVRFVETARERLTPDVLRRIISRNTKVVAVSWVSFEDGYRHDLAALAEIAHEHGALFCVDAIQGLGAFPIDVDALQVDALYCGGAKWMLALQGVSFLYVSDRMRDRLRVASPGWRSAANIWDFRNYEQPFAADAAKFEGGTPIFAGAVSLAESVAVISEAGPEAIARHVLGLTDRLVEGLSAAGADIASVRSASESSGIVTFSVSGTDPIALGRALQRDGIVTTYRANGIRVSPHGYNTGAEMDALVEAVRRYQKEEVCSR